MRRADRHANPAEQAGADEAVLVGKHGPDPQRAGVRIELVADEIDRARRSGKPSSLASDMSAGTVDSRALLILPSATSFCTSSAVFWSTSKYAQIGLIETMLVSVVTSCETRLPMSTKWRLMRPLIGAATVHQSKLSWALSSAAFGLQDAGRGFVAGTQPLVHFLLADGRRVLPCGPSMPIS